MNRFTYSLLLALSLPLLVARLWWRGRREPGYRRGIGERLGRYRIRSAGPLVWVHAVSVGEARAAAPLVRALREALPDHQFLVTCTTAAGRDAIRDVYGDSVLTVFLPYDLPWTASRFLAHFSPRLAVLMETEVWPNLVAACKARGIPVALANARLSEKSAAGYRRHEKLTGPAFAALSAVCAQSEDDARRLRGLGATTVEGTGNLKFDATPDESLVAAGRAWKAALGRPVLLLASTREGEEKLLLEALPAWDGRLLVVVVPRHPRRFDEVAALCEARRSRGEAPAPGQRTYLGDTMGEMAFYYGACDVAVIGGSFAPLGGQNLIEALAAGAPVVMGPSVYNFSQAVRLAVEAKAAVQAADAASAMREALRILESSSVREAMRREGLSLCDRNRGAAGRQARACLKLLGTGSRA